MIEIKEYYINKNEYEKNKTEFNEAMSSGEKYTVCPICGLSYITHEACCPVCGYEIFEWDDIEDYKQKYKDSMFEYNKKFFNKLKEKYEKEFGTQWKEKMQDDNFYWLVDKMEDIYI